MSDYYLNIPVSGSQSWKDPVATSASLPSTGNVAGDARVTNDTQGIYVWSGAAWILAAGGGGGSVNAVTASSPIASSGGSSPNITIQNAAADGSTKGAASFTAADFNSSSGLISLDYTSGQKASGSQPGFLSSTDFTIFNNKGSGSVTNVSVVSANGMAGTVATATSTPAITLSTTVTGLLKGNGTAISAQTTGNLTDAGTDGITITSGTGAVLGSGTSIAQHVADATHNGYLSSTDFTSFSSKGSGTVTSVAATVPAGLSISGSPVTASGTLAISLTATQAVVSTGIVWSTGSVFEASISGDFEFVHSGMTNGQTIVFIVISTGTNAVTWTNTILWPNGTAPTQSTDGTDIYTFIYDGTSIYGSVVQNFPNGA